MYSLFDAFTLVLVHFVVYPLEADEVRSSYAAQYPHPRLDLQGLSRPTRGKVRFLLHLVPLAPASKHYRHFLLENWEFPPKISHAQIHPEDVICSTVDKIFKISGDEDDGTER